MGVLLNRFLSCRIRLRDVDEVFVFDQIFDRIKFFWQLGFGQNGNKSSSISLKRLEKIIPN